MMPGGHNHIGPMAQDFYAAFGLGDSDKHIAQGDAQGVALAAVQGLNQKLDVEVRKRDAEIVSLRASVKAQRQHDAELRRQLQAVLVQVKQIQNKMEVLSAGQNGRSKNSDPPRNRVASNGIDRNSGSFMAKAQVVTASPGTP